MGRNTSAPLIISWSRYIPQLTCVRISMRANMFLKGTSIPPMHLYPAFKTTHTFELDREELLCEEVLYVSDTSTQSHYALNHPCNKCTYLATPNPPNFHLLTMSSGASSRHQNHCRYDVPARRRTDSAHLPHRNRDRRREGGTAFQYHV